LKNFTSVEPPLLSTDAASKQYVTEAIDTKITQKYSGFEIYLTDDDWVPVIAMLAGSYVLTVSPMFDGGPTGTFSVSKSSNLVVGNVIRTTLSPGYETGEQIELKWGINEKIMVRKTGPFHDGFYRIDDSLKNLSTLQEPPVNPTDTVDLATVQQMIANALQTQYYGVTVVLTGTDYSVVAAIKHGSYMISISPVLQGGPTSMFSISKNEDIVEANIIRHASHHARDDPLNEIEITWNVNETLKIRKTGLEFDGNYTVDFSVKNFISV
jgi:hypothetical protein